MLLMMLSSFDVLNEARALPSLLATFAESVFSDAQINSFDLRLTASIAFFFNSTPKANDVNIRSLQ
jgi:hypothetical protein